MYIIYNIICMYNIIICKKPPACCALVDKSLYSILPSVGATFSSLLICMEFTELPIQFLEKHPKSGSEPFLCCKQTVLFISALLPIAPCLLCLCLLSPPSVPELLLRKGQSLSRQLRVLRRLQQE